MLIEQRSPEWFALRKGKITSSEIYKIMGDAKGKDESLSETAKTYLLEKIAEKLGGESQAISTAATEWGTDLEDLAVQVYSYRQSVEVQKCSFILKTNFYGGSPDGLVGTEGTLEIKCPFNSANHLKFSMINSDAEFKKVKPEYYYQCLSHMAVTDTKWCDFVSFDPRLDVEYTMSIYRLHRNQEEIDRMWVKLNAASQYMEEVISKLPKYEQPLEPTVTSE